MSASLKDQKLLKSWMRSTIFNDIELVRFYSIFSYNNALQTTNFETSNTAIKVLENAVGDADIFTDSSNESHLSDAQSMKTDDE